MYSSNTASARRKAVCAMGAAYNCLITMLCNNAKWALVTTGMLVMLCRCETPCGWQPSRCNYACQRVMKMSVTHQLPMKYCGSRHGCI